MKDQFRFPKGFLNVEFIVRDNPITLMVTMVFIRIVLFSIDHHKASIVFSSPVEKNQSDDGHERGKGESVGLRRGNDVCDLEPTSPFFSVIGNLIRNIGDGYSKGRRKQGFWREATVKGVATK